MSDTPLRQPAQHESGARHTTGEALYVDDFPEPRRILHGVPVPSPHPHARILARDGSRAGQVPGVVAVLFAEDIPGDPGIGPMAHDEPVLATDEVHFRGQAVALVLADSVEAARDGVEQVAVSYEPLPAVLTIAAARERDAFLTEPHVIARGDAAAALDEAPVLIEAEVDSGGQEHFYLETQAALAIPKEGGTLHVVSSTQHPTEVQKMVAHVLGCGSAEVVVEMPRMGGAFGGKESQASNAACLAALGVHRTGQPVKVWLNRDDDMTSTGKRHPFHTAYRAGFDREGRLLALEAELFSDGGWVLDLSGPVMDRALFHADNAYYIPDLRFEGRVCRTNLPSNTAFRGFGGPQGMLVVEDAMNRAAERLGLDPAEVRRKNYYGGDPCNIAPYGQTVTDIRIHRIHEDLLASADYEARREALAAHNAKQAWVKRGIGFQPVKFGISFTNSVLNQAGALVHVFADGTVQLNHGGTEMGQGLHTKMRVVTAHELGVPVERVRIMNTATDKVPNTSATAASSGSDLNGQAVRAACEQIRERMRSVAADLLGVSDPDRLEFAGGRVREPGGASVGFDRVAGTCWARQVHLSAAGFYRTPDIWYDHARGRGKPFHYYAWGGCVSEVEVNGLTGEHRILRADILHDVGDSLVPSIDIGQVEGGYVQGAGWLTCEEVLYDTSDGRLLTPGPSTYKIPAVGDCPADLRIRLLDRAAQPGTIHGSKAVGEPPFMLAISVVTALRHAIAAFGPPRREVDLALPATPEAILRAIEDARGA